MIFLTSAEVILDFIASGKSEKFEVLYPLFSMLLTLRGLVLDNLVAAAVTRRAIYTANFL
jgi:hypothetical protein